MGALFEDVLWLLAGAVLAVVLFQRARLPSSLGYLLIGVALGPSALGLIGGADDKRPLAEFGIVFLLFTIGLNFSLPQILSMRHQLFGLGTAQVALTTLAVGACAWAFGLPIEAAFVVGAVFAQSSTTIISKQLAEQGEQDARYGRLAVAMSVFQDVTAVPFLVVIPVLGGAAQESVWMPLGAALLKAAFAFVLVLVVGRRVLRRVFNVVASHRSAELFTLTMLLVILSAALVTSSLGLSMALGAFLAGMVLGDTEFRHQLEVAIRPFRDVLLGLFFVTIGMLVDLKQLPSTWHWALLNAAGLLAIKAVLVAGIVRWSKQDAMTAWRTGLTLAVGGEFGFALLSIALGAEVIDPRIAQIVLTAVLFSMIGGAFLIRFNGALVERVLRPQAQAERAPAVGPDLAHQKNHVIICGYGRMGRRIADFLGAEGIPYVALDLDSQCVREAHASGLPVYYGDASEREMLEAVGAGAARLVVVSHDDFDAARKTVRHVRALSASIPIMARAPDERAAEELMDLGATEAVPETLEAAIMIASHALLLAGVQTTRVFARMHQAQSERYHLLRELFDEEALHSASGAHREAQTRMHTIELREDAPGVGRPIAAVLREGVRVQALVRRGTRRADPDPRTLLQSEDVLVLFGPTAALEELERELLGEH